MVSLFQKGIFVKNFSIKCLVSVVALLMISFLSVASTTQPVTAQAYIISPQNGAEVTNPITVVFGLKGMGVAPAGVEKENTGHHHLLIDTDLPKDLTTPLPSDEHHKHFGGGQTETTLTLTPGKHSLQLLLGDFAHVPLKPIVASEKIHITVK